MKKDFFCNEKPITVFAMFFFFLSMFMFGRINISLSNFKVRQREGTLQEKPCFKNTVLVGVYSRFFFKTHKKLWGKSIVPFFVETLSFLRTSSE